MIVEDFRLDSWDDTCELSARIRRSEVADDGRRIWYRFPADLRPDEIDASAFVPGLLQACMWLREPLTIDGPVAPRLLAGAEEAKELYRRIYPQLADVPVEAGAQVPPPRGDGAACFFTRGADSWYSVLRGLPNTPDAPEDPLTLLFYSPTSDYFAGRPPLTHVRKVRREATSLTREAARSVGMGLSVVESNVRAVVEPHRTWDYTYGALLASMGLAAGGRLARVHIAGSLPVGNLVPLGSRPDLDPLFSTEGTEIVHDGADVTRVEKLRYIAGHPEALQRLKVCINQTADTNCGDCGKCVRTMIGLSLVGALDEASFDQPLTFRRAAGLVPRYRREWAFHRELVEAARAQEHGRLQAALRVAEARGKARARVRGWRR